MHYVYLTNSVVTDQAQVDPSTIFFPEYASQFIEAPDEVTFGWTSNNGNWIKPNDEITIQQQNQTKAQILLQQTDWTCTVDITNSEYSNPYLTNQPEFLSYRSTVRAIAVNPPTTPATFPTQPQATWSS